MHRQERAVVRGLASLSPIETRCGDDLFPANIEKTPPGCDPGGVSSQGESDPPIWGWLTIAAVVIGGYTYFVMNF
jgi:hypothetical protein